MTLSTTTTAPGAGRKAAPDVRSPALRLAVPAAVAIVLAAGAGWAFASWEVHGAEILATLAETGLQGCL